MSFATTDDLAAFLNRDFDAGQTAQAQMFLDGATAAIRSEASQRFTREESTALLAGGWDVDLELPERPVVEVAAVKVNGIVLHTGDFEWNTRQLMRRGSLIGVPIGGTDQWGRRPGAALGYSMHWGGPASTIEVTYVHGFDPIPDDIRTVCLQAAARPIVNPDGLQAESLGAYSATYARNGSGGPTVLLDDIERKIVRRYRIP